VRSKLLSAKVTYILGLEVSEFFLSLLVDSLHELSEVVDLVD
jgi:uncharacterized membrane protein YwzB